MEALRDPEVVEDIVGDAMELLDIDIDGLWAWLRESVRLREGLRLSVVDIEEDIAVEMLGKTVLDILGDALTDSEDEGVLLGDTDDVIDWATDDVDVPEAGSVATSNPIDAGGIQSDMGAVISLHGRAYTPN